MFWQHRFITTALLKIGVTYSCRIQESYLSASAAENLQIVKGGKFKLILQSISKPRYWDEFDSIVFHNCVRPLYNLVSFCNTAWRRRHRTTARACFYTTCNRKGSNFPFSPPSLSLLLLLSLYRLKMSWLRRFRTTALLKVRVTYSCRTQGKSTP